MAIHRDDETPPSHPYNKNYGQNRHPQSPSNASSLPRHSSSNQSSPLLCQHNKKSIPVPSPRRTIASSVTSSPVLYQGSNTKNTYERIAVHTKHSNFIVDPYQILEIPRDATRERIVESYHRLALLNHPSRIQHGNNYYAHLSVEERSKQTQEEQIREWKFIALAASYETLSVEAHRRQYDILSTHQVSRKSRRRRKRTVMGAITPQRMFLDTSPNKKEDKDYIKKSPINPTETICKKYSNAGPKPSVIGIFSERIPSENNNVNPSISLDHEHVGLCAPRKISGDGGSTAASSACNSVTSKNIFQCKLHFEDSDDDIDYASDNDALEYNGVKIGSYDNSDDDEDDECHSQSTAETNQLFGGPLSLLYRARNHEPFMDPFQLFRLEFGSDIFRSCMDDDDEDLDDCWAHSNNHGSNAENDVTMKRVQQKLKRLEMQRNKNNDKRNPNDNSTYSRPTDRHGQDKKLQQSVDFNGKDGNNNTSLGKYHSVKEQKLQSSRKRRLATGYPTLPPLPPSLLNNNRGGVVSPGIGTASSPYTSDTEDGTSSIVSISSTSLKNNPTITTSEEIKDGVFIKRIVRNVNGNRMVRTETTTTDPVTGKKRTTIAVSKEVIDNDDFDRLNYDHPGVGSTRDKIPALINNQYTDDLSPDGVGWACCNTQSDCFKTKPKSSSSPSFRSPFICPPPPSSAPVPSDFNDDVTPRHSNIATSSNMHEVSGATLQKKSQEKKNLMWSHFGLSSNKPSSRDEKESIGLARFIFGCGGSFVPS